ncbi:MAG: ThiF family adenylyltransferase [Iamia sp.]
MTGPTLAVAEPLWAELTQWLDDENEVAGVLTATWIDDDGGTTLLARHLERAPSEAYDDRQPDQLALRSSGWVPAVRAAAVAGEMAFFVHTHPGGTAEFSTRDDHVDDELWAPFTQLTSAPIYGALLLAGSPSCPQLAGRLRRADGSIQRLAKVRVVGDGLTIYQLDSNAPVDATHDRQIRALGQQGQQVLADLRVGIVGIGGTGSPIAEQLIRLGVGTIVAIDDDTVTASTVSRGYGSTSHDINRPKVEVLARHARTIGLGTNVVAVSGNLRQDPVARTLRHCDVVFCCVDGHAGRLVLNRWAYWHLAPVIDVAVLVTSTAGHIDGIDGRITWLAPGAACLLCRGRVDPALAQLEQLDPTERRRLTEQGYAPDLDEPQPSIVTYTTLMAGHATTELLNRLYGLADRSPTELLFQLHARTTSMNRRQPRHECFCANTDQWAQGTAEPYLDLTWTR